MMPPYTTTPAPRRRRRAWPWVVLVCVLLAGCAIGGTVLLGSAADQVSKATPFTTPHTIAAPANGGGVADPVPVQGAGLTAKDLTLTAKITQRQCFGSAGCNVQYTIRLAAGRKITDAYTVTYTVHGFDDGDQVGTLDVADDGTYEQDPFMSGSVKSAKTKLVVKITEVERA